MHEEYFAAFLKEKGMSQGKFSRLLGFTPNTVNRWFHGWGNISPDSCFKIKKVFPDFDLSKARPDLWG